MYVRMYVCTYVYSSNGDFNPCGFYTECSLMFDILLVLLLLVHGSDTRHWSFIFQPQKQLDMRIYNFTYVRGSIEYVCMYVCMYVRMYVSNGLSAYVHSIIRSEGREGL